MKKVVILGSLVICMFVLLCWHIVTKEVTQQQTKIEEQDEVIVQEDKYSSLTNSDKRRICEYIESRYEYYDSINGGYSGDEYSDRIMREAANRYGLTVSQIEIIWMNLYSY